jgi:hypothetical protein
MQSKPPSRYMSEPWQDQEKRLLSLVDIKTATRLMDSIKRQYHGKTYRWHLDKALYDLERDRH